MSFIPYQVDYSAKNASKTFGFSKKRVSFKFGIANPDAISQGLTGPHCRGSEHEIIFIWSLNSGKRQILADGKDVHYSESGQNGWTTDQVFQHHFQIRVPNFSVPFRCHLITQPANKDVPSLHPFDLRVNGASYFSFSKIFQLGTPQMITRPLKGSRGQVIHGARHMNPEDDPYCTPDERKAIAAAKLASLKDLQGRDGASMHSAPTTMNRNEGNLINLLDDPTPVAPALPPPSTAPSQFVSSMTMDPSFAGGAPPPAAAYGQQPYSNYSLGAPPPAPAPAPFGAPPPAAAGYGYGAPPPATGYGQPGLPPLAPAPAAYGQPPAPNAMGAYQQPPAPQAYGFAQPPPAAGFSSPPPSNMMSPTGQSVASYGSAPSFAQPPRQQAPPAQPQYPGYPQY